MTDVDTLATADVVVVGAGIAGLCTAWELKRRGFDVVVVEQRFPAFGATGRNPGSLWLQTRRTGLELDLARAGRAKYGEFLEELGDVFEFRTHGGLFFFESDAQGLVLEKYVEDRQKAGLDIQMVSREEARDHTPLLPETAIGAVYCAEDAQIDSQQFISALGAACRRRGVRHFDNTAVLSTLREGDNVVGVRTVRGEVRASGVVWATGAWATNLRAEGFDLPIRTARGGQLITQPIDTAPSAILHGPRGVHSCGALLDLPAFNPALFAAAGSDSTGENAAVALLSYDDSIALNRGGSLDIGTSIDAEGSLNPHISLVATHAMVETSLERYPQLSHYGVTGLWAGLMSDTADHLPIVDRVDGAYVTAGHLWGVASGPICGQIMADLIAGEPHQLGRGLRFDRPSLQPAG